MTTQNRGGGEREGHRGYRQHTLVGHVFEVRNRYTDLEPFGRGAYGLVAKAQDLITGRNVAIKKIENIFRDNIDAKRTLREVKLLRHLGAHGNVTELIDIMTEPPESQNFRTLYIVTQCYETDLERIINSGQRLSERHFSYFVYQLLRALKYIHSANVLHRDLKPSNLLVNSNCDLAICDFGLARGISLDIGELTEDVVTLWYRAPEVLCGQGDYDSKVDLWSVGCILGEFVTREALMKGNAPAHQLQLIVAAVGKPSQNDLAEVCTDGAARIINNMPEFQRPAWRQHINTNASPELRDLLERLLVFNPRKRLDIEGALSHPFFAHLRNPAAEPLCEEPFNFEFERDYPQEMPRQLIQEYIYNEMLDIEERHRMQTLGGRGER
eukprot:gb/GECG01007773.1/.p1 GENE.gb/GECG01007773.1/~~gb/GECG01007773.1/.p1  ORF type:complete len:383 (+),score=35.80 gb/GECG01007773.1/:1-1149(+)